MRSSRKIKNIWVVSKQYERRSEEEILLITSAQKSEEKIMELLKYLYLMEIEGDDNNRFVKMYNRNKSVKAYKSYKKGYGNILHVPSSYIYKSKFFANIRTIDIETGEISKDYDFERINDL